MYDNKRGKWLETTNEENDAVRNYPSMSHEELMGNVAAAIEEIYLELGEGLPDCVYQLKLHNLLIKKGFHLQAEKVMINKSLKPKVDRSLIINTAALAIEHVITSKGTGQNKKMMIFDLEKNNFERGLLVNLTEDGKRISITEVKKTNTYH